MVSQHFVMLAGFLPFFKVRYIVERFRSVNGLYEVRIRPAVALVETNDPLSQTCESPIGKPSLPTIRPFGSSV